VMLSIDNLAVPLGIGTMMWGNTPLDRPINGRILTDDELAGIVKAGMERGVTFFDTAEGYGGGTCETRLSSAVVRARQQIARGGGQPIASLLATKFLPTLWRWSEASLMAAVDASNKRMGLDCCPLYFLHSPTHPLALEVWIRAAAKAHRAGKLAAFGLSNCNARQVVRAVAEAKKHNLPIVANQIMFNLLVAKSPEVVETLRVCEEHGIRVIAYAPVGQGLLCDGLTAEKAKGIRLLRMTGLTYGDIEALRAEVAEIAERHRKTMGQVAIQYVVAKGCIPLVGCRTETHVHDAVDGVVGWRLTKEEVMRLDKTSLGSHTFERPRWRRSLFIVFISLLMTSYKVSSWLKWFGILS
jgi:aryl-alcohol dehydrogenase-like predicted oxidoreductase